MQTHSTLSTARVKHALRGDLDNIVLKALRKEAAGRYASVEQFAEDIDRHLKGLPVIATRGSWSYRIRKFGRRHWVGAGAISVVLIAVVAGTVATVREARIAAINARRAETRFNDVRKLANSFLFEIHDSIEHLQGSTPARELIVKRALEYLDNLSQEASSDPALQLELVNAYEKVGAVQGSPYRDNLGNTKGALQSFQKAIVLLEPLVRAPSSNADLRSQLARDYGLLGDIRRAEGDLKVAMEFYRKGLDALEAETHPNMKTRIRSETLYDRYGLGLAETGQLGKAVDNYQKAIATLDELIREDPADPDDIRDKGVTSIHLAECYLKMRRLAEALKAYQLARSLFESLEQPGNAQSTRDFGVADAGIADMLLKTGDARAALAIQSQDLAQDQLALKADPSNALLRNDVYTDLSRLAITQSALGEMRIAMENQRKAVALNEAESAKDPNAMLRKDLETNYFHLGEILRKAGRNSEALGYYEKAHAITEPLSKTDSEDTELRADLAAIKMNESDLRLAMGDSETALSGYRDGLAIAESLVTSSSENGEWQILQAQLTQKLGESYALRAKTQSQTSGQKSAREEALRWLRKSRDLWKQLQQRAALGSDYANAPAETDRDIAGLQAPALNQN